MVSNHGGRQLDGVAATLRVLPEIVAAVGDKVEVLLDGGIRRGGDIVEGALPRRQGCAGGARLRLRPRGRRRGRRAKAIQILRADLVRTLKLLGCPSVADLGPSYADVPSEWRPRP